MRICCLAAQVSPDHFLVSIRMVYGPLSVQYKSHLCRQSSPNWTHMMRPSELTITAAGIAGFRSMTSCPDLGKCIDPANIGKSYAERPNELVY
jgi:hypothetical protein